MPKNNAPQIDGRLSETEIKIKKIKKEMRDRKSQGQNQDGGLTILLKEKIQNILNELLGDHLKILQQIKTKKQYE